MIAIILDDAIYLFIYFLHFISMLLRPSLILKTIQKMGERKKKLYTSKQIIIILPMKYERRYHKICWGRGGLVVKTSDSGSRGRGVRAPLGSPCCVLEQEYW